MPEHLLPALKQETNELLNATVHSLWSKLETMEHEKRFGGQSYPPGMCSFPFRLEGQGFFPGGDGLWRSDHQLDRPLSGVLPRDGLMFVGNDFGTLATYEKLKSFENPPTWKNLKKRVRRAELLESTMFSTNAVMGLRTAGTALDKRSWERMPLFLKFCREFFVYQMETVAPQLVVVLGPVARTSVQALIQGEILQGLDLTVARVGRHTASFLYSSHPYGDFNFSDERKDQDAASLRNAWQVATARLV
jgi:uracil-DNA glycosylase